MSVTGAERVYRWLLRMLPRAFRVEYGTEMMYAFASWRSAYRAHSPLGVARFWLAVVSDLGRSVAREWWSVLRERRADEHRPPYGAATAVGCSVLLLYVLTLAPTIGFWDAAEYVTVAHILGIPHPPGNPLFVLLAHVWERLLSPFGLSTAMSINLFSAVLAAGAHALWFLVIHRALASWSTDRTARVLGACFAVLLSATAFTVWSQSNVNEKVYTVSLFTTALAVWMAMRWRDGRRAVRPLALLALLVALTATNHLMGVLVLPALVAFVVLTDRRVLLQPRLWTLALPLALLALSVQLFLPVRAAQRPLIAEGDPQCDSLVSAAVSVYTGGARGCRALSAVLQREQYAKPPITADPTDPRQPRGVDLVGAQVLNWLQYADWQWARSVGGDEPLFGGLRPVMTLIVLMLAVLGARAHWRSDRNSALLLGVLLVTLSAGLVVYLNFRYGFTIARDRYPQQAMHEVRERDYFFIIGFSVLGLWAGVGLAAAWRGVSHRLGKRMRYARVAAAPLLAFGLLPLALNWHWASRADDYTARDWAYNVLMSVKPYGVLVTNGDNDSFPLWYLQEVEGIRQDVTVLVSPYLSAPWYLRQVRDLTEPCPPGVSATDAPTRIVCQRQFDERALPHRLVQAGWTQNVDEPVDSILPLSDEEIARIAGSWFVAERAIPFRAGAIETTIAASTLMDPTALYLVAILRATVGKRPIHFMPAAPLVRTLGLSEHVVRQGLVWRLENASSLIATDDLVALPRDGSVRFDAAAIDLTLSDTLLEDVYLRRGRLLDDEAPWQDHATVSIPLQYAFAHQAAALGHAVIGQNAEATAHLTEAEWWKDVALNQ